ncbi:MAG: phosphopantothenoylcysteine decarboxylase domain-containing protein, partial [Candidatus Bathyanammoxibius sp.]
IWPQSLLVGFKLEAGLDREGLVERARELISSSGADMVVANDITQITGDSHVAYIVSKTGDVSEAAQTKGEIAARLVKQTAALIAPAGPS